MKPGHCKSNRKPGFRATWAILALAVFGVNNSGPSAEVDALRIGFTTGMFKDVNENDARAAIKVWGQTVAKQSGVAADPQTLIFKDAAAVLPALQATRVDAVGMSIFDYQELSATVRFDPVFVTYNGGCATERYAVAARKDSKISTLGDLRGRNILVYEDARSCVALPWLDTYLGEKNYPPTADFFSQITRSSKISKTVMPVFFHQADACLVTRSGFALMVELNPQIGKDLEIIACSEDFVPVVFAFRADYQPPFRDKLMKCLPDLQNSVAGRQILTLFHCEKMEIQPPDFLRNTMQLIAVHAKSSSPTNSNYFSGATNPGEKQRKGGS